MKKIKCSAMGGTCDTEIAGNSAQEIAEKGMEHVKTSHPDLAAKVMAMSPEETDKWMAELNKSFNEAPEVAA